MRLNKFIAQSSSLSRRKADEFIKNGRVRIGNVVVNTPFQDVAWDDSVFLDDKKIEIQNKVYFIVNKPGGYTCTTSDPHAEKKITELVPASLNVFPVGRLDKDSRGLIILTNDGDLAYKLTHPKFQKEKEYIVKTRNELTGDDIQKIEQGIMIEGRKTSPVKILKNSENIYRFILKEGRKRQIRKMVTSLGNKVVDLERIRIGNLKLENIPAGKYKEVSAKKIRELFYE